MTPTFLIADAVSDSLTRIAGTLQTPVHIVAILLLLVLVLELGRAAAEWTRRLRPPHRRLVDITTAALAEPARAAQWAPLAPGALAERTVREMAAAAARGTPNGVDDALADYELSVERRLDRTRLLVRAGPAVGLMGTLIPLGPGIAALGRGDVAALAGDLRTAFAATVIGILVGTVAFALTLARTRIYTEDLAALERAAAAARFQSPVTGAVTGAAPLAGVGDPAPVHLPVVPPALGGPRS